MTPTEFEEQNALLSGEELGVQNLPIHLGEDCVVSCWEPSDAEMEEIKKTGKVYLCVVGTTHAPLFLTGNKADIFQIEEGNAGA
jgi:hypothetical protein